MSVSPILNFDWNSLFKKEVFAHRYCIHSSMQIWEAGNYSTLQDSDDNADRHSLPSLDVVHRVIFKMKQDVSEAGSVSLFSQRST